MEKSQEKFGLIGKTLKHSYSKSIHALLGEYDYDLYEIQPEKLGGFIESGALKCYNVTIPYKTDVMKHLDYIDDSALSIGAVNTVVTKNGKKYGFNTDFYGMIYMLRRANITLSGKTVMILGTGGTSKTANAVAKYLNAKEILIVSRSGQLNYNNYQTRSDAEIIINTTPVGMYPDNYNSAVDLNVFDNLSGVVDVIYNPSLTKLLYQAKEKSIPFSGGLPMLVAQAKYAMEKFFDKSVSDDVIEGIIKELEKQMMNVVLVGMPGSGKTTVGKEIARLLNREFIDVDEEIVKREKIDIPTIFQEKGEEYFRNVEKEVIKDVGKLSGKVISTGGGAVKSMDNYYPLICNSHIFYVDRDLKKLSVSGRPLSKDAETVKKLYEERKDMYAFFAEYSVDNNGDVKDTAKGVIDKL